MFSRMKRFGHGISLFAAASLLFANIACTCAVAGTHAGHDTATDHTPHHALATSEHHHGSAIPADDSQPDADPNCHEALADCADCGVGAAPMPKSEREPRTLWTPSDFGDKVDLPFLSTVLISAPTDAPTPSQDIRRPSLPAANSPVTRKDQLTE